MSTKKSTAADELAKAGVYIETPELVIQDEDVSIDLVNADADLREVAASEQFMNELLKIRVATTTDVNAAPFVVVTVNDTRNRVLIPRGVVCNVKRMHVEVLARMRETRYVQPERDMMNAERGNELIASHAMVYPFEIISDPNPKGRVWFERIMAEPTY